MKSADRQAEKHTQKSGTLPIPIPIPTPTPIPIPGRKNIGEPVFTATKQITRYTTVKGIESDISYLEHDWPLVAFKELKTNAWDFENDSYPSPTDDGKHTKDNRWITVSIKVDKIPGRDDIKYLRISVRNSNIARVEVFKNLPLIFDFDIWGSTKRGQNRGTGGALGDFLKRVLGMGYASWYERNIDTHTGLQDIQWPEPLILRFNGQEYKAFIKVDKDVGDVYTDFKGPSKSDAVDYIEVCATLPVDSRLFASSIDTSRYLSMEAMLQNEYRGFVIGKHNYTTFNFELKKEKEGDA